MPQLGLSIYIYFSWDRERLSNERSMNEQLMRIGPDESEIRGSWLMTSGQVIEDEACRRINVLTTSFLTLIAITRDGWGKLYQDPRDGRCWELTYPHGEMHGGGPPSLFLASLETIQGKYGLII